MRGSLEQFAADSPDAVAQVDASGGITYANRAFHRLFRNGRPFGTIKEMSLPEECSRTLWAGLRAAQSSGAQERFVLEGVDSGRRFCFQCRVVPLADSCGETDSFGYLLEMRDTTEIVKLKDALRKNCIARRQVEQLNKRSRNNVFGVLEEFPAFVYMQRQDYTVAYTNKKVRDLYGGDTESRLCYEVFAGRDSPCPVCPTFEVFETRKSIEWEFIDEHGRTFRIYDYPFEDETGEPLVMELGIDITELKRVEKELFQAQKLRAIGVLAGGLAHDLNNNLVPIIFNIDHALGRTRDADIRDPLDEALQAAYRAAKLVEQVLEYSRQQVVSRAPLHLKPIALECLHTFRARMSDTVVLTEHLDITKDCVSANTGQVQQVILNLLRNAEQSMPDGGEITFRMAELLVASRADAPHPEFDPGAYVVISIADTGSGIRTEDQERIFEPFFTTKKKHGGTGMGLALVHSIVNSCGGCIHVESEPEVGTVFTLYLPQCPVVSPSLTAQYCTVSGDNNRILMVDDDHAALAAMARTLRNAGFDVATATSGEQGLRLFNTSSAGYGLVLADLSMPGINGLEMSEAMLEKNAKARIVICTGHVEPALEQKAKSLGVVGFIMKPTTPSTLVENVRKLCVR